MEHPKTSARDFFLYLFAIGTLFVCVWRFIDLIFEYINLSFPDQVETPYDGYNWVFHNAVSNIRASMATLIIVFPVYLGITWFLRKDIIQHPEKRELMVRKWLLNFTLFAAAITIIADLVTLVNNFLEGELTVRFFLKVLTVFVVAAAVLSYYFWDLKQRETSPSSRPSRFLAGLALFFVFGSIVSGFFLIGSPATQRNMRLDDERVQNLQWIQNEVINYWQHKEVLPEKLSDLKNTLSGFTPPRDPVTGQAYEYRATADLKFELCAVFALPSNPIEGYTIESKPRVSGAPWTNWNWQHDKGQYCFERTIDPDLYPPQPEK